MSIIFYDFNGECSLLSNIISFGIGCVIALGIFALI